MMICPNLLHVAIILTFLENFSVVQARIGGGSNGASTFDTNPLPPITNYDKKQSDKTSGVSHGLLGGGRVLEQGGGLFHAITAGWKEISHNGFTSWIFVVTDPLEEMRTMPTLAPTLDPTTGPTIRFDPTQSPTSAPVAIPTSSPTLHPSAGPTVAFFDPTQAPTAEPSASPTFSPTLHPTTTRPTIALDPTLPPTPKPSTIPTASPTLDPTTAPTILFDPTQSPTMEPSAIPSQTPIIAPSILPSPPPITTGPTHHPSYNPSGSPSPLPSNAKSHSPSETPTMVPSPLVSSDMPSEVPTQAVTPSPSDVPSELPTQVITPSPSDMPLQVPTQSPTLATPSQMPSKVPSQATSLSPSDLPSDVPSQAVTANPSQLPSEVPSQAGTVTPSLSSAIPSQVPSEVPSQAATQTSSSVTPSDPPSNVPTQAATPSLSPATPSQLPSEVPSQAATPSLSPSILSQMPSSAPQIILEPSGAPSTIPTLQSSAPSNIAIAPTSVPTEAPVENACPICGDGKSVSSPTAVIGLLGANYTCGELQELGNMGSLSTLQCLVAQGLLNNPLVDDPCDCQPIGTPNPPTAAPPVSSVPSPIPSESLPLDTPSAVPKSAAPSTTLIQSPSLAPSVIPTAVASSQSPSFVPALQPLEWMLELTIAGEALNDRNGWDVSMSADGTTLAVGAYFADGNGENSGQVRIMTLDYGINETGVTQVLSIPGEATGDFFGGSVSLAGSGAYLAAAGETYVQLYQAVGGNPSGDWSVTGRFDFDADFPGSYVVALSKDESTLAIASWNAMNQRGAVQFYRFVGADNAWLPIGQQLEGAADEDMFGFSVALDESGNTVAIGALRGQETRGYARVYNYTDTENSWNQVGEDFVGDNLGDYMGRSIDISPSGETVVLGVYQCSSCTPAGTGPGYVSVFRRVDDGWAMLGERITGIQDEDQFGVSVALADNGSIVAIGANGHDAVFEANGLVQVWGFDGVVWTQIGEDVTGNANNKNLGVSLTIAYETGSLIAAGGPLDSSADRRGTGDALVYKMPSTTTTSAIMPKQITSGSSNVPVQSASLAPTDAFVSTEIAQEEDRNIQTDIPQDDCLMSLFAMMWGSKMWDAFTNSTAT